MAAAPADLAAEGLLAAVLAAAAAWAAGSLQAIHPGAGLGFAALAAMALAAVLPRQPLRDGDGWRIGPIAAWILVATALYRAGCVWGESLPLSSDEAQYWDWSRHLDLSYYSKPPLTAWLIAGWTELAGDSAAALRSLALLLSAAALWWTWLAVEHLAGRRVAWIAVLAGAHLPLFAIGSQLLTTDTVMIAAAAATLAVLVRCLPGPDGAPPRLGAVAGGLALGAALACGLLAKYAMVYLVAGAALALRAVPAWRSWLGTPGPWIALGVALAGFSPVLWWNQGHDWVGLRHLAGQAGFGSVWQWWRIPEHVGGFLGSQAGLALPAAIALGPALIWAWRGRTARPGAVLLGACAAVPLAVVTLAALHGKMQPNWAAIAWLPGTALAAWWLAERWPAWSAAARRRAGLAAGACAALCLVAQAAAAHPELLHNRWWNLPPAMDPQRRVVGWDQLGRAVAARRADMPDPARTVILTGSYHAAAALAFYVDGHPQVNCVNLDGRRMNQYDLWPGLDRDRAGWDALFVDELSTTEAAADAIPDRLRALAGDFASGEAPERIAIVRFDATWRTFLVWRLHGFDGRLDAARPGFTAW